MSWGTNVFFVRGDRDRRVERDPDQSHEADDGEQGQGVLRDPDRERAEEAVVPGRLVDLRVDPLRAVVDQPADDGDADQGDHVAGRDPDDRDEGEPPDHRDRREVEATSPSRSRTWRRRRPGRCLDRVADRLDERIFARLLLEPGVELDRVVDRSPIRIGNAPIAAMLIDAGEPDDTERDDQADADHQHGEEAVVDVTRRGGRARRSSGHRDRDQDAGRRPDLGRHLCWDALLRVTETVVPGGTSALETNDWMLLSAAVDWSFERPCRG